MLSGYEVVPEVTELDIQKDSLLAFKKEKAEPAKVL